MNDGKNFFDQQVKNDKITYENIRKIAIGYRDGYTTCSFLDCAYFRGNYKMIAIDLCKQQELDADRLILLQIVIEIKIQKSFSFLKKQKKF